MRQLVIAEKVKVDEETFSSTYGKFTVEPLEKGFGTTLGNSLRRVLLSSIPGAAVTAIQVEGATHEFTTLTGVKEDILEIVQNFKQLRFRMHTSDERQLLLEATGRREVTAADIEPDSDIEIINPDLHIASLANEKSRLSIQLTLAQGYGYVLASEQRDVERAVGVIPIDAVFSPVKKVKYEVFPARIGRKTSYDSLVIEIWTDGSILPDEALRESGRIFMAFLGVFLIEDTGPITTEIPAEVLTQSVDAIGLPTVASNALRTAGVETLADVVSRDEKELLMIHNFGEKSLMRLKGILTEYELALKEQGNETSQKG